MTENSSHAHTPAKKERSLMERIVRWVGAISAIISFAFGVQQVVSGVSESASRERQIGELKQLAQVQKSSGDYSMAWESLESALKLAESGGKMAKLFGHLDAETIELRTAREDLAMAWLDDIHIVGGGRFSDVVDKLLPSLEQGSLGANPERKADLLAHIGWSQFLRSRDGMPTDPQRSYEEALKIDSSNPFANAYLAHWTVWKGGNLEAADAQFAKALQANREKERVRILQLAAYSNRQSDGDASFVVTVAQMLAGGEKVSADTQSRALWHLTRACTANNDLLAELAKKIPGKDLAALYATLRTNVPDHTNPDVVQKIGACLAKG